MSETTVHRPDPAPYRTVVVGLGNIAGAWLPAVKADPRLELVAAVDPRAEIATALLRRTGFPAVPVRPRLEETLQELSPDLVVNLTPPHVHPEIIALALDAGCHVFSEKPLTADISEAIALADRADSRDVRLSVMQNRRFAPGIRLLRSRLAAGDVGAVVALSSDHWMSPHHDNTYLAALPHPLLTDMSLHTFDQARFLSGADAVRVSAYEYNPAGSWYGQNAAAVCTFELTDGSVFSYRGNWATPGFSTSYDSTWRVSGTDGAALWNGWDPEVRVQTVDQVGSGDERRSDDRRWQQEPAAALPGHAGCLAEMVLALTEDRPAETDARDNLRSLAMVEAAIRSSEQGRWVELAEILAG